MALPKLREFMFYMPNFMTIHLIVVETNHKCEPYASTADFTSSSVSQAQHMNGIRVDKNSCEMEKGCGK